MLKGGRNVRLACDQRIFFYTKGGEVMFPWSHWAATRLVAGKIYRRHSWCSSLTPRAICWNICPRGWPRTKVGACRPLRLSHPQRVLQRILIGPLLAAAVRDACSGIILTDEDALVETLCARTKSQLERVDQAYREKYQKSLWAEVGTRRQACFTSFQQNLYSNVLPYDTKRMNLYPRD